MANQYFLIGHLINIDDNSIIIDTETDKIIVKVSSSMLEKIQNYCNIGGVIGARGKITTTDNKIELICEKCTFLSTTDQQNSANQH